MQKTDFDNLLKKLRHLLQSDFIRKYDEIDPKTGKYRKDIREVDNLYIKNSDTYDALSYALEPIARIDLSPAPYLQSTNEEATHKKRQIVVRTYPSDRSLTPTTELTNHLEQGYTVVMVNQIGKDLEYILEKIEDCENDK